MGTIHQGVYRVGQKSTLNGLSRHSTFMAAFEVKRTLECPAESQDGWLRLSVAGYPPVDSSVAVPFGQRRASLFVYSRQKVYISRPDASNHYSLHERN